MLSKMQHSKDGHSDKAKPKKSSNTILPQPRIPKMIIRRVPNTTIEEDLWDVVNKQDFIDPADSLNLSPEQKPRLQDYKIPRHPPTETLSDSSDEPPITTVALPQAPAAPKHRQSTASILKPSSSFRIALPQDVPIHKLYKSDNKYVITSCNVPAILPHVPAAPMCKSLNPVNMPSTSSNVRGALPQAPAAPMCKPLNPVNMPSTSSNVRGALPHVPAAPMRKPLNPVNMPSTSSNVRVALPQAPAAPRRKPSNPASLLKTSSNVRGALPQAPAAPMRKPLNPVNMPSTSSNVRGVLPHVPAAPLRKPSNPASLLKTSSNVPVVPSRIPPVPQRHIRMEPRNSSEDEIDVTQRKRTQPKRMSRMRERKKSSE